MINRETLMSKTITIKINDDFRRYIKRNYEKFKNKVMKKFLSKEKNLKKEDFKINIKEKELIDDRYEAKWQIELKECDGYSREMNQIMLKYAIYENDSSPKLTNLFVEEDISYEKPTWYTKFGDNTMRLVPNKYLNILEENYQEWIKKDKEDAQKIDYKDLQIIFEYKTKDKNNNTNKMKYKGAVFLPEKKRAGFEVGYLSNVELHDNKQTKEKENKDENKKYTKQAACLYRITDHVIAGDKKEVEDFMKQFKEYLKNLEQFN